nr:hypothetical protein [uncultured Mediterranean phage uvMED]|tara:strand:+ start:47 stop:553 length:507 start_codon:yes stop_codon:yes gene_type:complete
MAKDFLNIIERAMLMGLSDKLNTATASGSDVFFYGEFPEAEEIKFPAIIIQQVASGFEEQMMGQSMTMGSSSGTGEIYGIAYNIHIICERDNEITIGGSVYKQRRLLNWIMLNVANELTDLDFSAYQEEEMEIIERHLLAWRDIGYMPEFQWYGASCDYSLTFKNYRS